MARARAIVRAMMICLFAARVLADVLLLLWRWADSVGVIDFLAAEYKADLYEE